MKESDNLDRIFQAKLKDYTSEAPMHLFAGVEQRRNKRSGFLFSGNARWLLLGLVLLAGAASIFLFQQDRLLSSVPKLSVPINENKPGLANASDLEAASENVNLSETTNALPDNLPESATLASDTDVVKEKEGKEPLQEISAKTRMPLAPVASEQEISGESRSELTEKGILLETPAQKEVSSLMLLPVAAADLDIESEIPSGVVCKSFKDLDWDWYLDVLVAPAELPVRSLEAKSQAFAEYAGIRRDKEKTTYGFSTGARVSAIAPNGLAMRVGLNYSQINELFQHKDLSYYEIDISQHFTSDGEYVYSDTVITAYYRETQVTNRYRIYDIPVLIGYEYEMPNVTLTMSGGAYFNLFFRQKGSFIDPNDFTAVRSFSSNDPAAYEAFRSNLGVSLVGSLGFSYRLPNNMEILLEPSFRYFLNPMTLQEFPVSQKYFVTGITTGVRIGI